MWVCKSVMLAWCFPLFWCILNPSRGVSNGPVQWCHIMSWHDFLVCPEKEAVLALATTPSGCCSLFHLHGGIPWRGKKWGGSQITKRPPPVPSSENSEVMQEEEAVLTEAINCAPFSVTSRLHPYYTSASILECDQALLIDSNNIVQDKRKNDQDQVRSSDVKVQGRLIYINTWCPLCQIGEVWLQ